MTGTPEILVLDADADAIVEALRARVPAELAMHGVRAPELLDPARVRETGICVARPDMFAAAAERLPGVRWVQSTWAGVRPMVPVLRARPEIVATGVKGIFGAAIAEYVLGWLLALDRRLLDYAAQQAERLWAPLPDRPLAGRRVALLGVGSIGAVLAERLAAFDMEVVGVNRSGTEVEGLVSTWRVADRVRAVRSADVLVSTLPDTDATRGLVDRSLLAALAPGAVVINVGRGSVIDEQALLGALASGALRAAVLDVFETEPLPQAHPFWRTPGVHVTPHVAAPTRAADLAGVFAANLRRWRAGRPLEGRIDPAEGY